MSYTLSTSYIGDSLVSGFNWYNGHDYSNGFVSYQSQQDAESLGLYSVSEEQVVRLGVDHNNTYSLDEGRPSIRLESKEVFNHGLFIADFTHMPPSQCGLWPAFWAYGTEWPSGGELDIIEGANTAHNNIISAHTAEGCSQDESQDGLYSGVQRNTDCYVGDQNIGCGYDPSAEDSNSYGDAFNAVGGGVYAMQWDDQYIKVWHFTRDQIPADISSKTPQPDGWGLPVALFGSNSCDVDSYFKDMSIVININFCGDYGDATWSDQCGSFAPTCAEYVANNPQAFTDAYWDVSYIEAYTWEANATATATPEPTTTTTMTSSSTTTVTIPTSPASSASSAPTNPAVIDDFTYLGCFTSTSEFSTFEQVADSSDMTLEKCLEACSGKTYASILDSQCSCASELDPDTRATSDKEQCSTPCPGNKDQFCGGNDSVRTVYANVQDEEHPQPPPMAAVMPPTNERYASTVTTCIRTPVATAPAQTRVAIPTGVRPAANSTITRPPISGATDRRGPSNLSVIVGVLVMALMMVM